MQHQQWNVGDRIADTVHKGTTKPHRVILEVQKDGYIYRLSPTHSLDWGDTTPNGESNSFTSAVTNPDDPWLTDWELVDQPKVSGRAVPLPVEP